MDTAVIFGLIALALATVFGGLLFFYYSAPKPQNNMRALLQSGGGSGVAGEARNRMARGGQPDEFEKIKGITKRKGRGKSKYTLDEKFFQAGIFSEAEKKEFMRMRVVMPVCSTAVCFFLALQAGSQWALLGGILGLLIGMQLPFSILDRRIAQRSEDIMFFLPLVIEQIVIGVSSSLDVGPCLQRVVQMADERDSHNSVTELVRHAQLFMKSGVSMEEALTEVGKLSGHTELKHAFMSLAQVAKHGGEITKQLQELADAVASQRETKIEAKIKKLELEATGPVGLVFVGFLVILLMGFGQQVFKAFQ